MSTTIEDQIIGIIKNVNSPNKEDRDNATNTIYSIMDTNYLDLLTTLASIISKDSYDRDTRLLACTVFKRCFEKYRDPCKWLALDKQNRETIKNSLICGLGTQYFNLQKSIAYNIAFIANYELPVREWPNLFNILSNGAAKEQNSNFKMTSLIILNNVLFDLKDRRQIIEVYSETIYNIIFNLLDINALKADCALFAQVLQTLSKYVPFLGFRMNDANFRKTFLDFLGMSLKTTDKEVIGSCSSVLNETFKWYYPVIGDNIDNLFSNILEVMQNGDDTSCTFSMFLLNDLAEEETRRKNKEPSQYFGYISKYLKYILDLVSKILIERPLNQSDEYNTPYETSSFLLDTLSRLCDTDVIAYVFGFISQYINSDNPRNKCAAVYAFYSILETSAKDQIAKVLPDGINMMVNFMNYPNEKVQENVAQCVERIAQFHGLIVIKEFFNNAFKNLYDGIIGQLSVRPLKNNLLEHYLTALHYLVKSIDREDITNLNLVFFGQLKDVIQLIFEICYSPGAYNVEHNACSKGFIALGTIIEHSTRQDYEIISQFVGGIFGALQKTTELSNYKSQEEQYDFQTYISTIIIALSNYECMQLTKQQGNDLYSLYSNILTKRGCLFDEALMAIPSIIDMMQEGKEDILDQFKNYLFYGLQQVKEYNICKYSLSAVQDLLSLDLKNMNNYLPQIMELAQKLINDCDGDKYLKTDVLGLFSTLLNNYKPEYAPYFPITVNISMNALYAFLGITEDDDEFYYSALLNGIVEYLECSARLLNDNSFKEIFRPHLEDIFRFIYKVCRDPKNLPIDVAMSCGGIIGDLCYTFGNLLPNFIDDSIIKTICNVLKKASPQAEKAKQLYQVLSHITTSIKLTQK